MKAFDLYPRQCSKCGKKFESAKDYSYKVSRAHGHFIYFCSWHCLRAFQQKEGRRAG